MNNHNYNFGREEMGVVYIPVWTTNKIWSGVHWAERKKYKDNVRLAFYNSSLNDIGSFAGGVVIEFTPLVGAGKRLIDTSNCSASIKAIEDCLVESGIIQDDSAKFVKQVIINHCQRAQDSGFFVKIKEVINS